MNGAPRIHGDSAAPGRDIVDQPRQHVQAAGLAVAQGRPAEVPLMAVALGPPLAIEMTGLAPWEACRRLADQPHLLFLDSALTSPLGRYSYLSAAPLSWLEHSPGGTSSEVTFDLVQRIIQSWR